MDTQHLPILITVGVVRHLLSRPMGQRMDWTAFQNSLETLNLRYPLETPKDVEEAAEILVDRIREAQRNAMASQPIKTSRRGNLPFHVREKMQQKRRLHKLWIRTRLT
ncbi:hypothetical protein EVAR_8019_1 [Eumeta japonica]|uniref:Uncharacterized protein n=1 Tax=Eumeta variegata TaxID=151549 RepID=A0A4C1TH40_EUMVA|nr:hypothetical protein EVAR_8019_1 [Eumeta japonica]